MLSNLHGYIRETVPRPVHFFKKPVIQWVMFVQLSTNRFINVDVNRSINVYINRFINVDVNHWLNLPFRQKQCHYSFFLLQFQTFSLSQFTLYADNFSSKRFGS